MKLFNHNDILELDKYFRISLINNISGLRSANLLGTKNTTGNSNLAIFNSVIHVGANPPLLGFLMRPLTVERHTYNNIKNSGYFTINQITAAIHQQAHQTSAKYDKSISEFEACNLSEEYINDFPIPFVAESNIKIGLSFVEEQLIKANNTIFMVGKIELLAVENDLIGKDGNINLQKAETVAIGGLDAYYSSFRLGRYEFARPRKTIKSVSDH